MLMSFITLNNERWLKMNEVNTQRVNDKNRPLTKNRTRYTKTTFNSGGYFGEDIHTLTHAFNNLPDLIREMSDDCPEIGEAFKGKNAYRGFQSCLDYNSREFILNRLSKGYASDKGWSYYKNAKSKLLASPERVAKLGSIGLDTRRKRRSDIAGCIVNIDKAMTGLNPMETFKRNNAQKSVRIFIDYAQSGSVDAERIIETATKAIAICEVLEKKGYATEVTFGSTSYMDESSISRNHFSGMKGHTRCVEVTKFIAKRAGEPINESKLVNYCVAGIFRDILFAYWKGCLGFGNGLGYPLYHKFSPEDNLETYKKLVDTDVYVGKNSHFSDILSNVVGHVRD
jgi:hypothetical protein